MGIQIITDSASDISQARAKEMGVTVLPLTVRFDEEEFIDGVTLSPEDLYYRLENSKGLPRTAQVTPLAFGEAFKKAREAGDEVICINISLKLSGCYQSACIAREEFPEEDQAHIRIIDSYQACTSQYILVEYAVRLRDEGHSLDEIAAEIEYWRNHVYMIGMVDTLEFLKRGGRVSAAAATFGSLLSIKPFITFENGVIEVIGKARGTKAAAKMQADIVDKYGGIDFSRPFCLGYSGSKDDRLRAYIDYSRSRFDYPDPIETTRLGATIGIHGGPGAVAVGFFQKDVHACDR